MSYTTLNDYENVRMIKKWFEYVGSEKGQDTFEVLSIGMTVLIFFIALGIMFMRRLE